jgi:hypothetical protein
MSTARKPPPAPPLLASAVRKKPALRRAARVAKEAPAYYLKGRPVYTQEQLANMTPEELKAIGWKWPDESEWVDELTGKDARANITKPGKQAKP